MSEFDRIYKLTAIRAPELSEIEGFDASFFEPLETLIEITDLRIEFKIEKHLKKQPNTAEFTITNLAQVTRDDFVRGPTRIRFEAGYGDAARLLFVGDLRYASNEKDGTEWLTKLQCADAGRAYKEARVNRSFGPGTPLVTALKEVAKAFHVTLPPEALESPDLQTRFTTGDALSGYACDELTRLLAPFGLEWSFQDERLQILRQNEVRPGEIRVFAPPPEGGMIGAPVMSPPKIVAPKKSSKGGKGAAPRVPKLTVKHLLYPEVTPGEQIGIQSRSISGGFRADQVTHEGDTFGDEWTTTVEAVSV